MSGSKVALPYRIGTFLSAALLLIAGAAFVYSRREEIPFHQVISPSAWIAVARGEDMYVPHEALFKEGNKNKSEVCLTFDDGPHPKYLPSILDTLKQYHVHGTFFEVGKMMAKAPNLVKQVLADGNEVGNHTMTHLRLPTLTDPQIKAEIEDCASEFKAITGRKMYLFRPPGMDLGPKILKLIKDEGYVTVDWGVGAHDYIAKDNPDSQDPKKIAEFVLEHVKNGSIILLHDAPGTAEALPSIIKGVEAQGYTFVKCSTLLAHLPKPVTVGTNASPNPTP